METQTTTCHCGAPAIDCGNGMEDICLRCFTAWERAGEPESCPCTVLTCLGCDGSGARVKWNNGRGRIHQLPCLQGQRKANGELAMTTIPQAVTAYAARLVDARTLIGAGVAAFAIFWTLTSNHGPTCFEDEARVTWGDTEVCTPVDNLPLETQQAVNW